MAPTYRVTLTNPEGLRLTTVVPGNHHLQPYDLAEVRVNADQGHARYGPWTAARTDRHS